MEKRKTIGIFLEGDDVLQEGLIANALIGEAQVKDYNIFDVSQSDEKAVV